MVVLFQCDALVLIHIDADNRSFQRLDSKNVDQKIEHEEEKYRSVLEALNYAKTGNCSVNIHNYSPNLTTIICNAIRFRI